jgi:hypothetical protein
VAVVGRRLAGTDGQSAASALHGWQAPAPRPRCRDQFAQAAAGGAWLCRVLVPSGLTAVVVTSGEDSNQANPQVRGGSHL